MAVDTAFSDVTTVLENYFRGIQEGDTDLLRGVFAPQARLYCATDEPLVEMSLDDYIALVEGRPSPASQNFEPIDRIVSIDFSGPKSALAKVELGIPGKQFEDFLTLLRLDGRWKIISKTYHYTE
jgi:4-oxalocrotonate tautomerase